MVRLGLKPSPPHAVAVTTVVTLMTPTHADHSRVVVFCGGRTWLPAADQPRRDSVPIGERGQPPLVLLVVDFTGGVTLAQSALRRITCGGARECPINGGSGLAFS